MELSKEISFWVFVGSAVLFVLAFIFWVAVHIECIIKDRRYEKKAKRLGLRG